MREQEVFNKYDHLIYQIKMKNKNFLEYNFLFKKFESYQKEIEEGVFQMNYFESISALKDRINECGKILTNLENYHIDNFVYSPRYGEEAWGTDYKALGRQYLHHVKKFISEASICFDDLRKVLEEKVKGNKSLVQERLKTAEFIHSSRIEEMISIKNPTFDLSRLVRMCEEINSSYINGNFLSVGMLSRAVVGHIPPVFSFDTFSQVANNYGSRSFKNSMQNLDNSMKKIADSILHSHIRKIESLLNENQINFSQDLDVLLAEICRKLKE